MTDREAEYYVAIPGDRIQCRLCPHACVLPAGKSGICRSRTNEDGILRLPLYGAISSIALDPIEKKPLRHYLPGTKTFSVGFWNCTMQCPFCQNWEIAHPRSISLRRLSPEELIRMATESGLPSISFTYSEPTLHIEYVKECMRLARTRGLKTILVTNGNLLERPARDILSLTDATNVDLKTYSAAIYHGVLGGELKVVKNFIQIAYSICHVEVTSLLVPGILDTPAQIEGIARFLSSLSREIPLHITAYHPEYRWTEAPFDHARMKEIAAPAYEYLSNVHLARPLPF